MNTIRTNRQVVLKERPSGMPTLSNFTVTDTQIPQLKTGEVLIKALYLSVDPYMRGRMNDGPSYVAPFKINEPISGDVLGEVIESHDSSYHPGEIVTGFLNWADYTIAKACDLRKINPANAPITTALNVLGMPGMTAYFGLLDIGKPEAGETVVISGAAGAVGSLVGQIAKIKGCRVVGICGCDEKVSFLKNELHFDEAVNYKHPQFKEELKKACPQGIDVYYDNVGGDVTDCVIQQINYHARIVICGLISAYNLDKQDIGPRNFRYLLTKSAMAKGFIVFNDYRERYPEGIIQMAEWLREGKIKVKETVQEGLENAPKAFLGLFTGANTGKQIVKV